MRRLAFAALLFASCTNPQPEPQAAPRIEDPTSFVVLTTVPTTTAPPTTRRTVTTRAARTEVRRIPLAAATGDVWWKLALCESGGRQDAYNPAGPYYSYFQWTLSTWRSMGGTGDPRNASYEDQKARAQRLAARSGFASQWPACSRKLGLSA